jgi:hypothetical protein
VATVNELEVKLSTHEQVCAIRYEGINARLKRIEMILIGGAGTALLVLLNIAIKMG